VAYDVCFHIELDSCYRINYVAGTDSIVVNKIVIQLAVQ